MGKMIYQAFILVLLIQMAFLFFAETGIEESSIYTMVYTISGIAGSAIALLIIAAIASTGPGEILVGSQITKNDWVWRATLAVTFFTFIYTILQVAGFITSKVDLLKDATNPIAMLVSGALTLFFIVTIIDFISGKD